MALRVVARLRDGSVLSGYTPAFEPMDGSVWISPAPTSPAGSMIRLDRVEVLVLESNDGRPVLVSSSAIQLDDTDGVKLAFKAGSHAHGRLKAEVPEVGIWVQPAGRAFARAFVPEAAEIAIVRDDVTGAVEDGWDFLVTASQRIDIGAALETPTDGVETPPKAAVTAARNSVPPSLEERNVPSDTAPTPVVRVPKLEAPKIITPAPMPAPSSSPGKSTSSATDILAIVDAAKTQPDLPKPDLDD